MGLSTSICWIKENPYKFNREERPMTKHFSMLSPELEREVTELHRRRKSLNPKEKRRYLWLAKKALYFYALEALRYDTDAKKKHLRWLLEAEKNLLLYLTHVYGSDEEKVKR